MRYAVVTVTPFQQNCTLLWCPDTRKAAVVDPGGDVGRILAEAQKQGVTIEKILLTHGHVDHVGGAAELAARLVVPVEGPQKEDVFWLNALPQQCAMFGFPDTAVLSPDRWLEGGESVVFGNVELEVLHTPGHTPGHVVYFHRPSKLALVGDVLFAGSIGRTDFPRGNHQTLILSIRERLWPLGDDVTFVPGHGPESTFGEERRSNPFVAEGLV